MAMVSRLRGNHVTDETLSRLLSDELSTAKTTRAHIHLAQCWQCWARHEQLEKAVLSVVEYRRLHLASASPQSPTRRDALIEQLDRLLREAPHRHRRWPRFHLHLGVTQSLTLPLAFAGIAGIALLGLFLSHERDGSVTATVFLDRATTFEANNQRTAIPAAISQTVRIRTSKAVMDRVVYRDASRRRRLRQQKLEHEQASLKTRLSIAGVSWDEPLSAATYRDWHNRQQTPRDRIDRSKANLLTLTTDVFVGAISEESLTVRATDFHPIRRTINFRDIGTVDIAELSYAVVSWNSINQDLFEPTFVAPSVPLIRASRVPPPSAADIDEAELRARLALNQLRADTGEQVEISRRDRDILVKGVVESTERKRDIESQLRSLPHVALSIMSMSELANRPTTASSVTIINEQTIVAQASPLDKYLLQQQRSREDRSQLSRSLFDSSITIDQECKAISDLLRRFGSGEHLNEIAGIALGELLARHRATLLATLRQQAEILAEINPSTSEKNNHASESPADPLVRLAVDGEQNLALCKELISGSHTSSRPAELVISELTQSVAHLRLATLLVPEGSEALQVHQETH
jgi:anti-sigma factor RsiW